MVENILWTVALVFFLFLGYTVRLSYKVYKNSLWGKMKIMFHLSKMTTKYLIVINCIAIFASPLLLLISTDIPKFLFIYAFIVGGLTFFKAIQPPFAVLLSTSSNASINLFSEMTTAVAPLRAMSLLDATNTIGFDTKLTMQFEGFRTTQDKDWRFVVYWLTLISPFIFIDARKLSSALREEIELVLSSDIIRKTYFLGFDYYQADLLLSKDVRPYQILSNEKEIIDILIRYKSSIAMR